MARSTAPATTPTCAAIIARSRWTALPGASASGATAAWKRSAACSTIEASTACLEGMWA